MNIFPDTSSLFKLYHKESNTEKLLSVFTQNKIQDVFLSSLAKVEFSSAIWKKFRISKIQELEAQTSI